MLLYVSLKKCLFYCCSLLLVVDETTFHFVVVTSFSFAKVGQRRYKVENRMAEVWSLKDINGGNITFAWKECQSFVLSNVILRCSLVG